MPKTFYNPLECWVVAQVEQEEKVIALLPDRRSVTSLLKTIAKTMDITDEEPIPYWLDKKQEYHYRHDRINYHHRPMLAFGGYDCLAILSPDGRWYTAPGDEIEDWEQYYGDDYYPEQFWLAPDDYHN